MQKEWKKDQLHVENTDGVSPYFNTPPGLILQLVGLRCDVWSQSDSLEFNPTQSDVHRTKLYCHVPRVQSN